MNQENPEIARSIQTGQFQTNYHDVGAGSPILLIHGSGPGVTAWANWRLSIPELAKNFRVIAPDMAGFGYTSTPENVTYSMDLWVKHLYDFINALGLEKVSIVGNSFGGALALALAIRYPERVNRLVLMGSVGVDFKLTCGLDKVWGYEASIENMKELLDIFAFDRNLVNDELAELRYKASTRPGVQESFSSMFPAPRQRWVEAMASSDEDIKTISHETLIIHGREDKVIPVSTSEKLFQLIKNSQLHLFGNCGHWTQIEQGDRFNHLLNEFLSEK